MGRLIFKMAPQNYSKPIQRPARIANSLPTSGREEVRDAGAVSTVATFGTRRGSREGDLSRHRGVNVPCPTHSGRRAHKSCHFCRKAICRLCEVRMRGHLYCSERCARDAGRHAVWRRVRGRPRHARSGAPGRRRRGAGGRRAGDAGPAHRARARRPERLVASCAAPPRGARRRASKPSSSRRNGFRLEGTASDGTAVFLFSGSRLLGAAPVENGRFRFEGIREKGPFRVGAMPLSSSPRVRAAAGPGAGAACRRRADRRRGARRDRGRGPGFRAARARSRPDRAARPAAAPARCWLPAAPPPPDLTRGPDDRPDILVSFDAGSSDRGATQILDALSARGIRTTIFLTGEFIRRYPDIVRRIAADGHEVGNHTDTHPHLTTYAADGRQVTRLGVDRAFVAGELARTARLYREATGRTMAPLWRAPFGEHNAGDPPLGGRAGLLARRLDGRALGPRRPRLGHGPALARLPARRPAARAPRPPRRERRHRPAPPRQRPRGARRRRKSAILFDGLQGARIPLRARLGVSRPAGLRRGEARGVPRASAAGAAR